MGAVVSGGSYDYLYCKVEDMADRIVEAGDTPERKRFAEHLRRVANAMHAIEWVDSCDLGKGDENEAIANVFDPKANALHDVQVAERAMLAARERWQALGSLANLFSESPLDPIDAVTVAAREELRAAHDAWKALVAAQTNGGGA